MQGRTLVSDGALVPELRALLRQHKHVEVHRVVALHFVESSAQRGPHLSDVGTLVGGNVNSKDNIPKKEELERKS